MEGIFRTTVNGHYLLANIALARIYGYDSPVELMASIKDIAAAKDCPIHTITPEERERVVKGLFS